MLYISNYIVYIYILALKSIFFDVKHNLKFEICLEKINIYTHIEEQNKTGIISK